MNVKIDQGMNPGFSEALLVSTPGVPGVSGLSRAAQLPQKSLALQLLELPWKVLNKYWLLFRAHWTMARWFFTSGQNLELRFLNCMIDSSWDGFWYGENGSFNHTWTSKWQHNKWTSSSTLATTSCQDSHFFIHGIRVETSAEFIWIYDLKSCMTWTSQQF